MQANIGLYSYGTALLAYTVLVVFAILVGRKRATGPSAAIAAAMTALWAGVTVASSLQRYPLVNLMQLAEALRDGAWLFFLLSMISSRFTDPDRLLGSRRWVPWFFLLFVLSLVLLFAQQLPLPGYYLPDKVHASLTFGIWLGAALIGLLLLEQLFRNSSVEDRWSIKHLCIGLGVLFAYDFFMYAEALLFHQLNASLWQARGFVAAISAVFLGVAFARVSKEESQNRLYLSRHVVFHSVTLLAAGIYLLVMALAGYFIQYLGGTWGSVLQISFLIAAGLLLLVLLFSGQIRATLRVWLSKHFFSYKYDYRLEWLQFTQTLARGRDSVPESIIQAMANLASSPSGLLFGTEEDGRFTLLADWNMARPDNLGSLAPLAAWLERTEWIIDLKEWRTAPDMYEGLVLPQDVLEIPRAWLIIPLMLGEKLRGILLLRESDLQHELNWEDRDLLKVAGRQSASHLAQFQANLALVESRQFEAFNRLSAYVVHDLKNILAQQSLIVSNAAKHRNNPDFIDDVINTVENSVSRMTRLMEQMRSGVRGTSKERLELGSVLSKTVIERSRMLPKPEFQPCNDELIVEADKVQLATVFNHIIQNAQEAAGKSGEVRIRLSFDKHTAIIEIEDDGIGMDDEFLRERLFAPFESTKGLTGMGIGAFESREFIRAMGGDIKVTSTPGVGSLFRLVIPASAEPADTSNTVEQPITIAGEQT